MKASIVAINWGDKLQGKTTLERWEIIKDIIKEEIDRCVPKKARRIGTKPIWMHRNILQLIRKNRRMWKAYTKLGDPFHAEQVGGEIMIATKPTRMSRSRFRRVSRRPRGS